jgi:hypothetical protein
VAGPPDRRDLRIPLGGLSQHAVRRRRLRHSLLHWPLIAAGVGGIAALVGVLLATAEPEVEVRLDATGYRIDGNFLAVAGDGVYQGAAGAVLVIDGRGVAGASADLAGRHMTGRCQPAAGGEACRFTLDGRPLAAADERTDYGWHRRYDDGRTVAIHLIGRRDTPVPFAVGR